VCALLDAEVEEYFHFLWGEKETAIDVHISTTRGEKFNVILNVPSNIQVIHSLKILTSGGGEKENVTAQIMQHQPILFVLQNGSIFVTASVKI
jgi:hypothetical protein